jgi:pyruvate dehydrogenase E2 component (dihydrolipoamide acetyltransferase)
MVKEFKLPELGENIESADVTRVMIKAGDKVEVDQTIMEIETDKATVEVPSTLSGTVKEVSVKAGDKAKVGQVIFVVDDSQSNGQSKEEEKQAPEQKPIVQKEDKTEQQPPVQEKPKEAPKAEAEVSPKSEQKGNITDFILPALGENIESAKVVQLKVKEGDKVEKDQIILEIETDKATIEVPSDISGIVKKVNVKEGENAKVGQVILTLESQDRIAETEGEMAKSKRLDEEEKGGAKVKESQVPSAEETAKEVKEEKPAGKETAVNKEEAKPAKPKMKPNRIKADGAVVKKLFEKNGNGLSIVPPNIVLKLTPKLPQIYIEPVPKKPLINDKKIKTAV